MTLRQQGAARWLAPAICLLMLMSVGCMGGSTAVSRAGAAMVADSKAAVIPPMGILYSNVQAPVSARVPRDLGSRQGTASVSQIALPPLPFRGFYGGTGLFSWGDASAQKAADSGGIQDVKHMDYKITTILMFYRKFTLTAYGD